MPIPLQILPIAGFATLLLAGCAGSSDAYPSLAIRDAERVTGSFTPSEPESPPPPPVASDEDVGAIADRARETHSRFMSERPGALAAVRTARGLGVESNARALAEVRLAVLSSLRGQTQLAMAELDSLQAKAATTFAPTGSIAVAQSQVAAFLSEQDEAIDSLMTELER